ncbi:hypothetical protein C3V41_10680 [Actinomyces sp. oral taxon 897]|nr:hypothetical protein C3V41_10680 [Actinomyces sp. oral taxon 897]
MFYLDGGRELELLTGDPGPGAGRGREGGAGYHGPVGPGALPGGARSPGRPGRGGGDLLRRHPGG